MVHSTVRDGITHAIRIATSERPTTIDSNFMDIEQFMNGSCVCRKLALRNVSVAFAFWRQNADKLFVRVTNLEHLNGSELISAMRRRLRRT